MTTRRRYAAYAAATIVASVLGGCALVAGLYTPRPLHCSDGIKNEGETEVDCGGECPKCEGSTCAAEDECQSLKCENGTCAGWQCLQGSKDPCDRCHRCANEQDCSSNLDCLSGFCADGLCAGCKTEKDCPGNGPCAGGVCLAVACGNGVKDTNEEGVDCGGVCAGITPPCTDGGTGGSGGSGGTGTGGSGGTSTGSGGTGTGGGGGTVTGDAGVSCDDDMKNQDETDTDCGGQVCDPCPPGKACINPTDCSSGVCASGLCNGPTCNDLKKNGDETDVDCGGVMCAKCAVGKKCMGNGDCMNSSCQKGLCQAAHCGNDTTDWGETDVDCGGTCSALCLDGQTCVTGGDCVSGKCMGFKCVAP